MQINLKQVEIERALKNYIAQQGIDLYGKLIALSFTAGRKESGISVDISIEEDLEFTVPAYTGAPPEMIRNAEQAVAVMAPPVFVSEQAPVEVGNGVVVLGSEDTEDQPKTTSLFG